MTREDLRERIRQGLDNEFSKDENGLFYDEIYADYRDDLPDEAAKEILSSKEPIDVLTEKISDWYQEASWDLETQAIDKLRKDPDLDAAYEENEDLFRDILFEHFYVKEPFDHYLEQDIELNIVIDSGNFNYDCVLEGFAHSYYGDWADGIDDRSSLLWLCNQQGVSKEELEQALKTGECYPEHMSVLIARHADLHRQLKDLGYVPNKPMDHYNQKGAVKALVHAESNVRNHTRALEKYRANLADCALSYNEFCEKWKGMPQNKISDRTPPSFEAWERRRSETQERAMNAISVVTAQLENDKAHLEEVLKEPGVAAAAKLRSELLELTQPYITMKQSEEYKKGRFLETVIQESENVTSHMNTLTVLVKMSLQEAMHLAQVINGEAHLNKSFIPEERTSQSSVLLSKDAVVGLYDPWYGSGSLFEIELVKPLEIPVKLIHDANIDGNLGYSINNIYGGLEYRESLEEIRPVPPELAKKPLNQVLNEVQDSVGSRSDPIDQTNGNRNPPLER